MCFWCRKTIQVTLQNNKHQPYLLRSISLSSPTANSQSQLTRMPNSWLSLWQIIHNRSVSQSSSLKFLAFINIFKLLLSFSYTCGFLDHTDFFTFSLCLAVPTEDNLNLVEHRAKLTRTLSKPSERSITINFLEHFQSFFPLPKINFLFLPEDSTMHTHTTFSIINILI